VAITVNRSVPSALAAIGTNLSMLIGSVWQESRQAPPAYRSSNNGFMSVKKILQEV
jgi:hypothetical protein